MRRSFARGPGVFQAEALTEVRGSGVASGGSTQRKQSQRRLTVKPNQKVTPDQTLRPTFVKGPREFRRQTSRRVQILRNEHWRVVSGGKSETRAPATNVSVVAAL